MNVVPKYQLRMIEHPGGRLEWSYPGVSSAQAAVIGIELIKMQVGKKSREEIGKFLEFSIESCLAINKATPEEMAEIEKSIAARLTLKERSEAERNIKSLFEECGGA